MNKTINVEGASKVTIEYPDGTKKVVEDEPLPKGFSGTSAGFINSASEPVKLSTPTTPLKGDNNNFATRGQVEWAAKQVKFYYALLRASAQALDEAGQLDWVPDWSDETKMKYYVYFDGTLNISWHVSVNNCIPYHPTREIARRVIDILEYEGIRP